MLLDIAIDQGVSLREAQFIAVVDRDVDHHHETWVGGLEARDLCLLKRDAARKERVDLPDRRPAVQQRIRTGPDRRGQECA